jgi:hypothetical protein
VLLAFIISNGLIQDEWFADVFYLGNGAAEVEGFGEDDFEDLQFANFVSELRRNGKDGTYFLHIYAV